MCFLRGVYFVYISIFVYSFSSWTGLTNLVDIIFFSNLYFPPFFFFFQLKKGHVSLAFERSSSLCIMSLP